MSTTSSIDYAELGSSVSAELESLRQEKQALEETIREKQARLAEISHREAKLARLSESLNALLTPDPPGTATMPAGTTAAAGAFPLESAIASFPNAPVGDLRVAYQPRREANQFPVAPQPREFKKSDFLKVYPHLRGAQQPIHVLAQKVLEYMNRPLKLRDLTNYILELGYRHGSQNFTNSVHTVLKYKRDHSGNFYFDPKARVWELAHWRQQAQNTGAINNAPNPVSIAAPESITPEVAVNGNEKVDGAVEDRTGIVAKKRIESGRIKIIKKASVRSHEA